MSEPIKAETRAEAPASAPEQGEAALSRKRRVALVTYLSILFAVAFLLVALSMVIENRHLQSSNAALKDDSQKTSANLTQKIQDMQREFDELKQKSDEQAGRIESLTAQVEQQKTEAEQQKADDEARIAALESEAAAAGAAAESQAAELQSQLAEAKIASESQISELTQRAEDAVTVSELLQKAIAANDEGNLKAVKNYLEQIEPMKDLLSPSELEWYDILAID